MDIEVSKQKFYKILKENNLYDAWKSEDSITHHICYPINCIVGLSVYLQILQLIDESFFINNKFHKIPHIKLLRECSRYIHYESSDESESETYSDVMGLKAAKEIVEALLDNKFLKTIEGKRREDRGIYSFNDIGCYVITDIGKLLSEEINNCFAVPIDYEINLLKAMLLQPILYKSDTRISEMFIKIYLDLIYYKGKNIEHYKSL